MTASASIPFRVDDSPIREYLSSLDGVIPVSLDGASRRLRKRWHSLRRRMDAVTSRPDFIDIVQLHAFRNFEMAFRAEPGFPLLSLKASIKAWRMDFEKCLARRRA